MLERKKNIEVLRQSMVDIIKDKSEDKEPSWFGCETCHIWKKEANLLKAKLNKALEPGSLFLLILSNIKFLLIILIEGITLLERIKIEKATLLTI